MREYEKRLTVIVPGYNNPEDAWRRCLSSVLRNIDFDDEVICIDDGSAKRPDFLKRLADSDSRIVVKFLETNKGQAVARNIAIEQARGEYITFVDSDDELLPGTYDRVFDAFSKHDPDVVMFGVRSEWVNERLYAVHVPEDRYYGALTPKDVLSFCENRLFDYIWNKVYRHDFIDSAKVVFDKEGMPCEDTIFILKCIMAGAKWSTIAHEGIKYMRTHSSSLSRYKPSCAVGYRMVTEYWRRYKDSTRDGYEILGAYRENSEERLVRYEWENLWRMNSPFSLWERFTYAKDHSALYRGSVYVFFARKFIYSFLRRWFYCRPIQKWHIKRTYPDVKSF